MICSLSVGYRNEINRRTTGQAELITGDKKAQTITYSLNTTVFQDFLRGVAAMLDKEEK